jgi:hypothetical protein
MLKSIVIVGLTLASIDIASAQGAKEATTSSCTASCVNYYNTSVAQCQTPRDRGNQSQSACMTQADARLIGCRRTCK